MKLGMNIMPLVVTALINFLPSVISTLWP